MNCILSKMNKQELIAFAQLHASTPLERALLSQLQMITTKRELRIAFWVANPKLARRQGGEENQTTRAKYMFDSFVNGLLHNGRITKQLASTKLAYQ